jgi:predicted dehydrogenase
MMIRAAIAGLGWWGKHMVRRMADSDALRIVAAIETNPTHESFAAEHGLRFTADFAAPLKDPDIDAIILCTPHSMHAEQVLAVAAARKHVFCEKPLALKRSDAERSVRACREAGVVLGIGHERRFEPAIGEVRRLIREGALGTIMHAEGHFSHDKLAQVPEGDWRTSPKDAPAAGMTAMGIHLTDLFIDLLGPVSEVFAATTSRVAFKQTGDVISAHLRFASGATGYVNAILVTPLYIKFIVFGSEAWVEVRNHTHPDTPGPTTLTMHYKDGRAESREYEWADTVKANLESFAGAIEGKSTYVVTDEQKVENIAVLEAICRSVAINAPVEIEPVA